MLFLAIIVVNKFKEKTHASLIQSGMSCFRTFEKDTKFMSVNSPWAGQTSS